MPRSFWSAATFERRERPRLRPPQLSRSRCRAFSTCPMCTTAIPTNSCVAVNGVASSIGSSCPFALAFALSRCTGCSSTALPPGQEKLGSCTVRLGDVSHLRREVVVCGGWWVVVMVMVMMGGGGWWVAGGSGWRGWRVVGVVVVAWVAGGGWRVVGGGWRAAVGGGVGGW